MESIEVEPIPIPKKEIKPCEAWAVVYWEDERWKICGSSRESVIDSEVEALVRRGRIVRKFRLSDQPKVRRFTDVWIGSPKLNVGTEGTACINREPKEMSNRCVQCPDAFNDGKSEERARIFNPKRVATAIVRAMEQYRTREIGEVIGRLLAELKKEDA